MILSPNRITLLEVVVAARKQLSVRLSVKALDTMDAWAGELGVSRSTLLRAVLAVGMSERTAVRVKVNQMREA